MLAARYPVVKQNRDNKRSILLLACPGMATVALPPLRTAVPLGKLVSMVSLSQGNPPLFRDVAAMLHAVLVLLGAPPLPPALHVWSPSPGGDSATSASEGECAAAATAEQWLLGVNEQMQDDGGSAGTRTISSPFEPLVPPLLLLTAHEAGLAVDRQNLLVGCAALLADIAASVEPPPPPLRSDPSAAALVEAGGTAGKELVPLLAAFTKRNEDTWRGSVRPSSDGDVAKAYSDVAAAAEALAEGSCLLRRYNTSFLGILKS